MVLRFLGREAAPLCIVLLVLTIELSYVAHSSWLSFFLYNGDSLTLPLFRESIARHEQLVPALSTQLLIFPEAVIYVFCSAVTTSIRSSLVLNAYVNLILIYAGVRGVAALVVKNSGRRALAAAVYGGSLIGLMLLERQTATHNLQFATLNLLTTYYYGVILGGLVVLAATLGQVSPDTLGRRRVGWTCLSIGMSTLTYFSDPLFLLWVTVPIALSVMLLAALRRIRLRQAAVVVGGQAVSLIVGSMLRMPFKNDIGSSATSYVDFSHLPIALKAFGATVGRMWELPSERIELIAVVAALALALFQFIDLCRRPGYRNETRSATTLLVVTFSLCAPLTDVLGVLISGNCASRYFIPVFVFSLLSLIPVVERLPKVNWHRVPRATGALTALSGTRNRWGYRASPRTTPQFQPVRRHRVASTVRLAESR